MKKGVLLILLFLVTDINTVGASNEILLKSRHFTPQPGITDAAKARIQGVPERAHVLVQLEYVPTIKQRERLEARGINLLGYVPNRAWFASIASDKAAEMAGLSGLRAITQILPEDKIAPSIRRGGVNDYSTTETGQAKLVVLFFEDVLLREAEAVVSACDGVIVGAAPTMNALIVHLPKDLIYELAAQDSVRWINQHYEVGLLNDGARAAVDVDTVQDPPYSLTGTDVVVGQWDGGCADREHEDLKDGEQYRVTCADGSAIGQHATHVAGTIIGNGSESEEAGGEPLQWKGMATNATIVSYDCADCYDGHYEDYDEAINVYNIDVSNNSWGTLDWSGEYDDNAHAEDGIVSGGYGKKISLIFGAGNEADHEPPKSPDAPWHTVRTTAVAKNIVVVGATDSDNNSLAPFSSRGPTADGRIKPDVVAPGCDDCDEPGCDGECQDKRGYEVPEEQRIPSNFIWSCWSENSTEHPEHYPYSGMNGTSCAAPVVAGTVALMLEEWENTHTGDPLPSTIKAILIQTAMDLTEAHGDDCTEGPDYSSGYGLINAKEAIDLIDDDDANNDVILEDSIVEMNDRDYFTVSVAEQDELKITLVWDDYPAEPPVSKPLVNDLDLIVRSPDGKTWFPWTLDPENPGNAAVTKADHLNNVEQVYVASVPAESAGTWRIEINGYEIPQSNQTYSVVTNNVGLTEAAEPSRFYVRDAEGHCVAWFGSLGNLVLKGTLTTGVDPLEEDPDHDEFRVQNSSGDVAIIDATEGNMYIKGELHEEQDMSQLSPEGFIIKNSSGDVVAYIDDSGHVYLKGKLYENSNL